MFGRYLSHHCIAVTNVSFLMKESINWGLVYSLRGLVHYHIIMDLEGSLAACRQSEREGGGEQSERERGREREKERERDRQTDRQTGLGMGFLAPKAYPWYYIYSNKAIPPNPFK
jgi:hypothetical protein